MPDFSKKFTDQKLKQLYGHLVNHYKDCAQRGLDPYAMYNEMSLALQFTLESPWSQSPLALLERTEKDKAYVAFNTIFHALSYKKIGEQQRNAFNPQMPVFNPTTKYVIKEYNYYHCHDSNLVNWLILSSIIHDSHYHHPHRHAGGSCCWPSNRHGHDSSSNEDCTKLLAALVVIALALIAAVLASIALYYMLNEFANSIERFCYNEGWLKGALMFATSIGFGAGSAYLTLNFGTASLIALAVAAGFNPVGVVIVGAVLLSVIGAGIGCFAMSMLYDSMNKSASKESLDPSDPERFRLTAAEEDFLINEKGIDPTAVKCAMVALRAEMANVLGNEKPIPSFFSRFFNKENKEVQDLLVKLRHLRQGDMAIVSVGDLCFDCRLPRVEYVPPPTYVEVQSPYMYTPSAPQYM